MKRNFAQFFMIMKRMVARGADISKEELIREFTNNRKSRLTELSEMEYLYFINWLKQSYLIPLEAVKGMSEEEISADNMRKKIISRFRTMGYNENGEADMERIYAWVIKYGYLKKQLNNYTTKELPLLVSQVERYYNSTLK